MARRNRPFAGHLRPGDGRRLTLEEMQRLHARARRLQGEAIATALRRALAVLARALSAVPAFVRYAAAGQAKRVPSTVDCGSA